MRFPKIFLNHAARAAIPVITNFFAASNPHRQRLEDREFCEHVTSKNADYGELLSFIQPPEVRVEINRIGPRKYRFDVSESVSLDRVAGNIRTSQR